MPNTDAVLTRKKSSVVAHRERFNYLVSMFCKAPLCIKEFDELIKLAKRFDKKFAKYLKKNYNVLV